MSVFRFKQFSVFHSQSTMKVGTDAVLLGINAPIPENCQQILDIGCGCGIIALVLAQRSNASIIGIDIDKSSVEEAEKNTQNSPWKERLTFQHSSIQDFCISENKQFFDLIVSNPPFFEDSLKSPFEKRNLSRHTDTLSLEELLSSADYCLSDKGYFVVILPADKLRKMTNICLKYNLFCTDILEIQPISSKPTNRIILIFSRQKTTTQTKTLILRNADNEYTNEYRQLTKDFLL